MEASDYPLTVKTTLQKVMGARIIGEREESPLGIFKEILINPDNGSILAIALLISKKVISTKDIRKWDLEGIKVTDESVIISPEEIVKLAEVGIRRAKLFGKTVETCSGKPLGIITDVLFDTDIDQILKIYVSKKFLFFTLEKRVLDFKKIFKITEEKVVVEDDLCAEKEPATEILSVKERAAA
ncbi:MAG: hypothetical protein UV80_C0006G0027 [Candidatus Peregrinibacteria bacterium GW2011_GWF2_43_17]|nr:MAG: hypothetical protein UV80_C0006G0027 [Candidatus Peregrinibacteria bacterium GW2011_GWF2_43_17]KKT19553.1 MAG: hypothetical protein UW03_C0016G0010 [Candidatus Peregrinibacteria bacterium GW2011_GWA2_43_8]